MNITPEEELLKLTKDNNNKLEAIRKNTSIITTITVIAIVLSIIGGIIFFNKIKF